VLTPLAADDQAAALRRAMGPVARPPAREVSTHDLFDALAELALAAAAAAGRRRRPAG
jgi:hypothetical protein